MRIIYSQLFVALLSAALIAKAGAVETTDEFPGPKSPEESLAAIQVLPGLKVELVAAEPLVEDPVAFDWGPDGRLWVAEMRDYPNGSAWNKQGDRIGVPGGRIKLLTDTDGDGRYDQFSIFLDDVPFPNGVKAWRSGVLVTATPTIFYAEDTDGDGIADKREVLFEGFAEGNQQHRANGLRWGIDNWLYVANGDSGGKIKSLKTGQELSISGRDLRIRPDDGTMEAQSGQTQFGRCCDDWGNWFGNNNSNPLWHYVLDDHYLRRNPHFTPPAVRRDVPVVAGAAPVFPISKTLTRFNDFHTANRFTSACSPEIYRDELFNAVLGNDGSHVFICEPVHNLVHHEVMKRDGVSFRSRRAESAQQREFFASADNWCRPVMVRTAPDGSVWIADMYRLVIEHPEWIPMTWQRKLDLRAGSDRGRIYRVSVANETRKPLPKLDQLDTPGLLVALHSANGWQRDMVQQLLLWKKDQFAAPLLERIAEEAPRAATRLQALATLEGLNALRPELIQRALADKHPGVRRYAVRAGESQLNDPSLASAVLDLVSDEDAIVRQQVAYAFGEIRDYARLERGNGSARPKVQLSASRYVQQLLARDAHDPYISAALLSSVNAQNVHVVTMAMLNVRPLPLERITTILGIASRLKPSDSIAGLVGRILTRAIRTKDPFERKFTVAAGLLEAVSASGQSLPKLIQPAVWQKLEALFAEARGVADSDADMATRVAAMKLLAVVPKPQESDVELFGRLLDARHPPELQASAVAALAAQFPDHARKTLLVGWRQYSPALRARILDLFATRTSWTMDFLAAVERGDILVAHIDARRRQQWLNHTDSAIRERAKKLFASEIATSRSEVVEQLQTVLALNANVANGKVTFVKKCATCHQLEGTGQNVGPDLLALTDKSPQSLLTAILDPNKAVEDKFLDYVAVTTDGRQFTGMLMNETSTSLTLVGQEGKQVALNRSDLEELQSTGKSLMPEGLEKDLSPQDLADVIGYVRSVSVPPKQFPGNVPGPVEIRDDGSIRLVAMHAKIYGPTLVFEEKHRNLGYWQSIQDHAVWTIDVPKAGKYRVSVDYACDDNAAGNRFVIAANDQTVGAAVDGTGSWENYRNRPIGLITLPQGQVDLVVRSDGSIRSALFDLRQITLHPQ